MHSCTHHPGQVFDGMLLYQAASNLVQVSELLAASSFQRYSGPMLLNVSCHTEGKSCFDFAAPPSAYPVRCVSPVVCN